MKETYREHQPASVLQQYISCFWTYNDPGLSLDTKVKPIIPDGCIDVIFDMEFEVGLVIGAMTQPIINHKKHLVGVRFKPGMAYPFFNLPMNTLTDLQVELGELMPEEAYAMMERLCLCKNINERLNVLNEFFYSHLTNIRSVASPIIAMLNHISTTSGNCNVQELSDLTGWSRQHLARKCLDYTGLSPKFLLQVMRFKNVTATLDSGACNDWGELAVSAGFYDQAHMINMCKKLTGLTPKQYRSLI